jgi:hypothetical protein
MKILNTDDLMEAVDILQGKHEDIKFKKRHPDDPAAEAVAQERLRIRRNLVLDTFQMLAQEVADYTGVELKDANWQGKAFAGLCASFKKKRKGQRCPKVIDLGDKDGDWE